MSHERHGGIMTNTKMPPSLPVNRPYGKRSRSSLLSSLLVVALASVVRTFRNLDVLPADNGDTLDRLDLLPSLWMPGRSVFFSEPSPTSLSSILSLKEMRGQQHLEPRVVRPTQAVIDDETLRYHDGTYPSFGTFWQVETKRPDCRDFKDARILVSGILTHPVAAEVVLALAQRCNAQCIVGLSWSPPRVVEQSLRLEYLMREIPHLQIEMVGGGGAGDFDVRALMQDFVPSHVLHFESRLALDSTSTLSLPTLHGSKSSRNQLHHICEALDQLIKVADDSNSTVHKLANPRVLYIASSRTPLSSTPLGTYLASKTLDDWNPLLLQTCRSQYGIDTGYLKLPEIYGPFSGGLAVLHDAIAGFEHSQGVSSNASSNNKTSDRTLKTGFTANDRPLLHIADAVHTILSSLEAKDSLSIFDDSATDDLLPMMTAPEYSTYMRSALVDEFQRILVGGNSTFYPYEKLLSMLSFVHKRTNPFGKPPSGSSNTTAALKTATEKALISTVSRMNETRIETATVSMFERRQHSLFPCISECSSNSVCQTSLLKDMVKKAKLVSSHCQYLVLMSNFSRALETLPKLVEATNDVAWPVDSICPIAFVSSQSNLIQALAGGMWEELNGKIMSNGWRLVWTREDESSMTPADYLLPKLAPGSFVSTPTTKRALFIEPQHFSKIPSIQAMWFLLTRLDAKKKKARTKLKGQWVTLPPIPSKHVALFSLSYNHSEITSSPCVQQECNYMTQLACSMMEQKGVLCDVISSHKSDTLTVNRRQLDAYGHSILNGFGEVDPQFVPVDTYMVAHHFSKQGRQLRCEWYDEQLFWSNTVQVPNQRTLEDLSLSYLLFRWRQKGWLQPEGDEDAWGELMLSEDNELFTEAESMLTTSSPQFYVRTHRQLNTRLKYYL